MGWELIISQVVIETLFYFVSLKYEAYFRKVS